jgi:GcrA cell cycle regulator
LRLELHQNNLANHQRLRANLLEEVQRRYQEKLNFSLFYLDKNFEPENPKSLEELTDQTCKWPIGHPNEEKFYFCGRKPEGEFPYCKLHVLYAFQPKGQKKRVLDKEDEYPEFIEKKVKSAG